MKRLILMRHAKSSWDDNAQPDIERPLNDRGRFSADLVGKWLAAEKLIPDLAILSNANRCQETWEKVSTNFDTNSETVEASQLYMASPDTIRDTIRENAKGDTVLLLGHQPGIGAAARAFRVDPAPAHSSFDKYPTGAATVLDFHVDDWSLIDFGNAELHSYISPKQLG